MSERSKIEAVIRTYFDAMYESDASKARAAFHPDACITGYLNGQLANMSVDEFADFCAGQQPSAKQKGEAPFLQILTLNIAGDTAVARVRDAYLGSLFLDTLTFLRVQDEWRIHNKLFHVEAGDEDHVRPGTWVGHVQLSSPSLDETEAFMQRLGVRKIFGDEDVRVLELRGGTHLVMLKGEAAASDKFDLMVEDIEETHEMLKAAGVEVSALERGRIHDEFTATEPAGNILRFMSTHVPDHSLV